MSAGHVHYYDIDGGVPRVLGVTTRFALAEHSGEGNIDGNSGRVMSHGKGWVLTGMCLKKDVEKRRVIIRGRIGADRAPGLCRDILDRRAQGKFICVSYSTVMPKRVYSSNEVVISWPF